MTLLDEIWVGLKLWWFTAFPPKPVIGVADEVDPDAELVIVEEPEIDLVTYGDEDGTQVADFVERPTAPMTESSVARNARLNARES